MKFINTPGLMKSKQVQVLLCFILTVCTISCSRTSSDPAPNPSSGNKKINSFTLTRPDGTALLASEYAVSISPDSVNITVPPLENRKGLKASLDYTGKSVYPVSGTVQDFTSPVSYTVTAEDGSTKVYTVKAAYAAPNLVVFSGAGNTFYALAVATGA